MIDRIAEIQMEFDKGVVDIHRHNIKYLLAIAETARLYLAAEAIVAMDDPPLYAAIVHKDEARRALQKALEGQYGKNREDSGATRSYEYGVSVRGE